MLTKIHAKADVVRLFNTLPERFKNGAVGKVYAQVIARLNDEGHAPLDPLLQELYPNKDPMQMRRELSTRIINRPWRDQNGGIPLRLMFSRPSKNPNAPSLIWFETDQISSHPLPKADVLPEFIRDFQAEVPAVVTNNQQISKAYLLAQAAGVGNTANPVIGAAKQDFATGLTETTLPDSHLDVYGQKVGEPRAALEAMLTWARGADSSDATLASTQQVLVLLGDYGSGKSTLCMQFVRILGDAEDHPAWPPGSPSTFPPRPKAQYIDCADLASSTRLSELNLLDLLVLALKKADLDEETAMAMASKQLERARAGELILAFDGLDELVKHGPDVVQKVYETLCRVLDNPQAAQTKGARKVGQARIIVSCRGHYFRDLDEQHSFFSLHGRSATHSPTAFALLQLLPWRMDSVHRYAQKRLSLEHAQRLMMLLQSNPAIQELASRPVLLTMLCEQLPSLLRLHQSGDPITASKVYDIAVNEWMLRNSTRHTLSPLHKPILMGVLASAMWSEGQHHWDAQHLDRWLLRTIAQLFPQHYDAAQAYAIQADLRSSAFLVRVDARRFGFAHPSFLDYFLARSFADLLQLQAWEDGSSNDEFLVQFLPKRMLNPETRQFISDIWQAYVRRLGHAEVLQLITPLARLLQGETHGLGAVAAKDNASTVALSPPSMSTPNPESEGSSAAPTFHVLLWDVLLLTGVLQSPFASAWQVRNQMLRPRGLDLQRPFNLRHLNLAHSHWKNLDLQFLPTLDVRGTNLLALRAVNCQFGNVLCNAQTNWAQSVLRDCNTQSIDWNQSDRSSLLVRNGTIRNLFEPHNRVPTVCLLGPWQMPNHFSEMNAVMISPDQKTVATAHQDHTVRLWDIASALPLKTLHSHTDAVRALAFSPDGKHLASASNDGSVRIWALDSGQSVQQITGHEGWVMSVAFAANGRQVLTGSADKTLRIWDLYSGQNLGILRGHKEWVSQAQFSPNGQQIVSSSGDGTVIVWDSNSHSPIRSITAHPAIVTSFAFFPDGNTLLTGSTDHTARIWDLGTGQMRRVLKGHVSWVMHVACASDGQTLATASADQTVRLWDANTGTMTRTLIGHQAWVTDCQFSQDGQYLISASADSTARLWALAQQGVQKRHFSVHAHSVVSAELSPDGNSVLTACSNHQARVWDARSGASQVLLAGHSKPLIKAIYADNGQTILTASHDQTVRLWHAQSGALLRIFPFPNMTIVDIAYTDQSSCVIVHTQDAQKGEMTHKIELQTGAILKVLRYRQDSMPAPRAASPVGFCTVENGIAHLKLRIATLAQEELPLFYTRIFVHGLHGPSSALFDEQDGLVDADDSAADTWLMTLAGQGHPAALETAPRVQRAMAT